MEIIYKKEDLEKVAQSIVANLTEKIIVLDAPMGAGKTTITKAIATTLGAKNATNSPTFSLVNIYDLPDMQMFYHFDLYRLENEDEALDIGIEEYLDSGNWCFIEWAEVVKDLLPNQYHTIKIEIIDEQTRKIIIH